MLRNYHKTWKDNQMIQLGEEAMKTGYKILTELAKPTSTTTRAQTMGLPADEFDECVLDDNASAVDGVAQPPVLITFRRLLHSKSHMWQARQKRQSRVGDASTTHSARSPLMIVADGMRAHAAE
jgi:hypothetical protein